MDNTHIVIIVLLVLLVVAFIGVVVTVVVGAAKIVAPFRNVARGVRRVAQIGTNGSNGNGTKSTKLKGKAKQLARDARAVAQKVRGAVRSDLNQLQRKVGLTKTNLQQLLARGFAILSGDPCAKFDLLWTNHINLTFYYGMLALASLEPISQEKQAKMDWAAGELLQIQRDLGQLMSPCVAPEKVETLQNLLRDHILIVAQIAAKWRADQGRQPFGSALVQSWYKNAADTVQLVEQKTGKPNNELSEAYTAHLNQTAAYLTAISQLHGSGELISPNRDVLDKYMVALEHVPTLSTTFCKQMQACSK